MGKGENAGNQHFLLFPQCCLPFQYSAKFNLSSADAFNLDQSKNLSLGKELTITRRQILDSSKDLADDNLKFKKKMQKVIQTGRKHCGKRRNCSLRAISPFPTVFSKGLIPRSVKRRRCVGMG